MAEKPSVVVEDPQAAKSAPEATPRTAKTAVRWADTGKPLNLVTR